MSGNINYDDYDEVDRLDARPLRARRGWSDDFKARIVEETLEPGVNIAAIARREGMASSQLYTWRRQAFDKGTVRRLDAQACAAGGGEMSFARVERIAVAGAELPMITITVNDATVHVRSDIGPEFLAMVMRVVRG